MGFPFFILAPAGTEAILGVFGTEKNGTEKDPPKS